MFRLQVGINSWHAIFHLKILPTYLDKMLVSKRIINNLLSNYDIPTSYSWGTTGSNWMQLFKRISFNSTVSKLHYVFLFNYSTYLKYLAYFLSGSGPSKKAASATSANPSEGTWRLRANLWEHLTWKINTCTRIDC